MNPNKKRDRELYSKIDYIASVSTPCTEKFVQIYPEFKDKAITIENLLDTNLLENQANEVREDLFPKKGRCYFLWGAIRMLKILIMFPIFVKVF